MNSSPPLLKEPEDGPLTRREYDAGRGYVAEVREAEERSCHRLYFRSLLQLQGKLKLSSPRELHEEHLGNLRH